MCLCAKACVALFQQYRLLHEARPISVMSIQDFPESLPACFSVRIVRSIHLSIFFV